MTIALATTIHTMLPSFLSVIVTTPIALSLITVVRNWVQYRERCRLSTAQGCQDPPCDLAYDPFGVIKLIKITGQFLKRSVLTSGIELFEKYGETYYCHMLTQTFFFTRDPRNMKHILSTRFVDFDSGPGRAHLFDGFCEDGIFAVDGSEWSHARALYRTQFSNTRLISDMHMMEQHTQDLIRRISSDPQPVDLQDLFLRWVFDIHSSFVLGKSVDSLNPSQSAENKRFEESVLCVKDVIARDGFLGPLHVMRNRRKYRIACSDIHQNVKRVIDEALEKKRQCSEGSNPEGGPESYSFAQALTEHTTDLEELRRAVTSMMIAAIEPVGVLLSSTFWLLARDERVFLKLRASVLETIGQGIPTFEQVRSVTYLKHVFDEAMRMFSPVPINLRTANKNTTLPCGGGADGTSSIFVKKGDKVFISSHAAHRNTRYFGDDANEFRPERWEDMKHESQGYIPFNSGPRACPAMHLAYVEASYVAIRVLQNFSHIENCDPRGFVEMFKLNLMNENGVLVKLSRNS